MKEVLSSSLTIENECAGRYRYGFNGQENELDFRGIGRIMGAEFWQYDTRLGRRWNRDPKPTVGISDYAAFNNNPIWFNDPLGDTSAPLMPRHPITKPSDIGYFPYNVIGGLVNGTQGLLNKAGDYLKGATDGDPVVGISNQVSKDYSGVKGFVTGQIDYIRNTSGSQMAADTKAYFSNPDNYFSAAEQALGIVATGKGFSSEISFSKINVARDFSLKRSVSVPVTEDLAFGLNKDLDAFSQAMGFKNYRQFTSGGFKPNEILSAIENPINNLHFNLTDFSRYKYLKFDPTKPATHGNITNWELFNIYKTPGALQRTTFYKNVNGNYNTVPNPF